MAQSRQGDAAAEVLESSFLAKRAEQGYASCEIGFEIRASERHVFRPEGAKSLIVSRKTVKTTVRQSGPHPELTVRVEGDGYCACP